MVFLGQLLSNVATLVLFGLSLAIVGRHLLHSAQAIGQVITLGNWGVTGPEWLVQRTAASLGVVLAMTSAFGLEWWLIEGAAPGTPPRVPHLGEFLGPFLIRFVQSLFETWPWQWYHGTLGTPVWGLRLVLLAGSTIFLGLLVRALMARQIWIRDTWGAIVAVLTNFFGGFLAMAMVAYWWPAGMGDRPFFTIVMVILCFSALGVVGGAMQGGSGPSSSGGSSYGGTSTAPDSTSRTSAGDDFWDGMRKRNDADAKAYDKQRDDERKAWEKRDKDDRKRREDEDAKRKKDQERDEADRRKREQAAAEELKWQLREAAQKAEHERNEARKKAEWEAQERRKAEEHRRKNSDW